MPSSLGSGVQALRFLAFRAIKGGALALPHTFYECAAQPAGQVCTVVHAGVQLKVTGLAAGVREILQRAAALPDCLCQNLTNSGMQANCAWLAYFAGSRSRPYAR